MAHYPLAEPTLLFADIQNNTNETIAVDRTHMFNLIGNSFNLFLISPNNEVTKYTRFISTSLFADSYSYILVQPDDIVSAHHFLWWTPIVPDEYKLTLQKIPAGKYKIYGTYQLPAQKSFEYVKIHSDTIEFVFLPFEKEYRDVLEDLNSLYNGFMQIFGAREKQVFESIKSSHSPYSEAAAATLVSWQPNFDLLTKEKSDFDETYPNSIFAPYILQEQFDQYLHKINTNIKPSVSLNSSSFQTDTKSDSILTELNTESPNSLHVGYWNLQLESIRGVQLHDHRMEE